MINFGRSIRLTALFVISVSVIAVYFFRSQFTCDAVSQFAYSNSNHVACGYQTGVNLPTIELNQPQTTSPHNDTLVIFVTGDGGWADLDQNVATELSRRGYAVVGLNSLWYFWQARTPDEFAADMQTIASTYLQRWHKNRLILVGYSQGADVIPFAVNRMRKSLRSRIDAMVLMGLGAESQFEIHPVNWLADDIERDFRDRPRLHALANRLLSGIGGSVAGLSTAKELSTLQSIHGLCIYGNKEYQPQCAHQSLLRAVAIDGGHHFGDNYAHLSQLITESDHQNLQLNANTSRLSAKR